MAVQGGSALRSGRRGRGQGQRGSATVELVVVFPVVLLLLFASVQAAIWYHGRTLAMLAAQDGLRAAQALDGTSEQGRAQAEAALAGNGADGFLTGTVVTASRTPAGATVTVTARSLALLPGTGIPLTQTASGPIERAG
jgi:Flp pilus assembly protein TadG